METQQASLNLRTPQMYKHICENPDCEKEFVTKSKSARFCTDQCRNAAWFKSKKQQKGSLTIDPEKPVEKSLLTSISSSNSLPAHAVFIISELTRSRDLLQKQLDSERSSRKESQKQKSELEKEIEKIKHEHALQTIKDAKPTGLNGLSENPLVNKLLDHVGPGLNAILMKFGAPGAPSADQLIAGTEGQLDGAQQEHLTQIINWYSQLTPVLQNQVYLTIDAFCTIPTPQLLDATLKRIQNLLKNGTTATPIATPNGTYN